MKVYIIDYKTVGAEGVREIEQGVDGDAVFFVTGDPTNLPVQINSILDNAVKENARQEEKKPLHSDQPVPKKKEEPVAKKEDKAREISADVLKNARAAFAKPENSAAKKDPQTEKPKRKKSGSGISDDVKAELKEAVKPVGLKAIEYARLYKSFSESADKNEYNIALTRNFKIQKKANDIYKLTRPVFEAHKGN
ncbi:MAG: hypothetical protein ACI4CS_11455 [Candidatus Weimeria sp.]